jgi:hypothetical protein
LNILKCQKLCTFVVHCCYMFRPHIGHHQTTLIICGDHCTVHFVLRTLRHIVVVVVVVVIVVNLLHRVFSAYLF